MPNDAKPLFRPLGFYTSPGCYTRYYLEIHGEVRAFRPSDLISTGLLLEIHPDAEHWRSLYPSRQWHGARIDPRSAAAAIIKACHAVGKYEPPAALKPKNGRPFAAQLSR